MKSTSLWVSALINSNYFCIFPCLIDNILIAHMLKFFIVIKNNAFTQTPTHVHT